jgi:hypothetical protein
VIEKELRHWVEDKIVRGLPQDDIVIQVAEQSGLDWQDAELLVEDVLQQQRVRINRRQAPLMLVLGLACILGGGLGSYLIFNQLVVYAAATGGSNDYSMFLYILSQAPNLVSALAFVLAISAGGVVGVIKTFYGMLQP